MKEPDSTGGEGALQEGLEGFTRQVAEFVKVQLFHMLHHVMDEIGLQGCFQLLRGAFHQRERELIFPKQMAVAIHKIQIETSRPLPFPPPVARMRGRTGHVTDENGVDTQGLGNFLGQSTAICIIGFCRTWIGCGDSTRKVVSCCNKVASRAPISGSPSTGSTATLVIFKLSTAALDRSFCATHDCSKGPKVT